MQKSVGCNLFLGTYNTSY